MDVDDRGRLRAASARSRSRARCRARSSQQLSPRDLDDAQVLPAGRDHDRAAFRSRSRAPATPATSATRSGSTPAQRGAALGRADRGRDALRASRPAGIWALDIARIEAGLIMLDVDYFSVAPRADRGAEVVAVRDQPRLGGERRARARSTAARALARRAGARRRRGASSGSRSTGMSFERALRRARPAAAAPDVAVAHQRAGLRGRRRRSATRRAAAGRRCSRSTSRSRTCARRTSSRARRSRSRSPSSTSRQRAAAAVREAAVLRSGAEEGMSAAATTRSSSAAGTTAWSPRPISRARAARRWCSSSARVVGGAAVTEEIFPGFKFSVFSYVVSLLRPEIIRDLDLPRHGLQILPLESTVTPLDNGDYLGSLGRPRRDARASCCRHSPRDAEAMIEFGRLMHHMAMAVKPILGMVPPDPDLARRPRDLAGLLKLGGHFRSLGRRAVPRAAQADDDEQRGLPRRVVRVRPAQGDEVGERHHRHVPRAALAGHGVRAAAPLHGRDRRRVPRLGLPEGRHRRDQRGDRRRGARARRRDPHRRRGRAGASCKDGRATGVALENGEEIARRRRGLGPRPAPHLHAARRAEGAARRSRRGRSAASSSAARRAR